jgi:hypothetical protein
VWLASHRASVGPPVVKTSSPALGEVLVGRAPPIDGRDLQPGEKQRRVERVCWPGGGSEGDGWIDPVVEEQLCHAPLIGGRPIEDSGSSSTRVPEASDRRRCEHAYAIRDSACEPRTSGTSRAKSLT